MPNQQYYNGAYMEETVHDLTTKIRQRKKSVTYTDKDYVEGSFNLRKYRSNNMHTLFYSNISEFAGNLEEFLMREHTKQLYTIYTSLVGSHNSSSMLMFRCCFMVVVFHSILGFMIELLIYFKFYHFHMWEVIQVKRVTIFCTNHGFLHYPNHLKHFL